ncbi:hypothetical protein [Janthinobacterium agaricidamnosum]|nr:hypothetical protein [Janthinobacterium agaricidamnosum]
MASGFLLGALGASGVALAEPPQRRDEAPQMQQQRFEPARLSEKHFSEQGQGDTRAFDSRAEDQRRAQQDRAESSRRNGRLTPDERRDLRRQINEAGQDIYANPPRR